MKRRNVTLLIGFASILIATMAYLGHRSAQAEASNPAQAPVTVPVTRGDVQRTVTAPAQVIGTNEVFLTMGASGQLALLSVRPGDIVEEGELLARLANLNELEELVAARRVDVLHAQRTVEELHAGSALAAADAQLELANARDALRDAERKWQYQQEGNRGSSTTVRAAKAEMALAKDAMERTERDANKFSSDDSEHAQDYKNYAAAVQRYRLALSSLNWYTGHPTDIQQAMLDAEVSLAEAQLQWSEWRWEMLTDGPDPLELALAEARVDLAQAQLAQAEESLAGAELRAPFDGTVLDILSTPGAILSPGLPVILMGDPSALEVRASVIEEDLPLIEVGQPAELFFDALPEVKTAGVLSRIVPRRIEVERPLYHILITLDAIPEGLVPGMTSDVSVLLDQRAEVLTLPRALVRANSDGFAIVRVWVGDHSEDRTVKVGMRGDVRVEIVDGLKEGEQVVAE
ncbi:MAG: efflux RND transporter periplasmic adaptor subunit [Chloroflexi bacterium]|nr:efflux RND transporter periplasmic adaptor subunit [Chloroflexota bacterium]